LIRAGQSTKAVCANLVMSSRRSNRIIDEKAYLLHSTAWKETSLILQVFTRNYGIVSMVARGAKRPYSVLRPVLNAFQPLLISWTGAGEIKTLTRADCAGLKLANRRALMSAWYMNELVLRLLPKEDAHPALYDAYDQALGQLAEGDYVAGTLRRFEWNLLIETGYGIEAETPDFNDPASEPSLRQSLRERIDVLLAGRPLRTRQILMDLQRY